MNISKVNASLAAASAAAAEKTERITTSTVNFNTINIKRSSLDDSDEANRKKLKTDLYICTPSSNVLSAKRTVETIQASTVAVHQQQQQQQQQQQAQSPKVVDDHNHPVPSSHQGDYVKSEKATRVGANMESSGDQIIVCNFNTSKDGAIIKPDEEYVVYTTTEQDVGKMETLKQNFSKTRLVTSSAMSNFIKNKDTQSIISIETTEATDTCRKAEEMDVLILPPTSEIKSGTTNESNALSGNATSALVTQKLTPVYQRFNSISSNVTTSTSQTPTTTLNRVNIYPSLKGQQVMVSKKKLSEVTQTTAKVSIGNTTISVPLLKPLKKNQIIQNQNHLQNQVATPLLTGPQTSQQQHLHISKLLNVKRCPKNQPTIVSLAGLHIKPASTKIVVSKKMSLPIQQAQQHQHQQQIQQAQTSGVVTITSTNPSQNFAVIQDKIIDNEPKTQSINEQLGRITGNKITYNENLQKILLNKNKSVDISISSSTSNAPTVATMCPAEEYNSASNSTSLVVKSLDSTKTTLSCPSTINIIKQVVPQAQLTAVSSSTSAAAVSSSSSSVSTLTQAVTTGEVTTTAVSVSAVLSEVKPTICINNTVTNLGNRPIISIPKNISLLLAKNSKSHKAKTTSAILQSTNPISNETEKSLHQTHQKISLNVSRPQDTLNITSVTVTAAPAVVVSAIPTTVQSTPTVASSATKAQTNEILSVHEIEPTKQQAKTDKDDMLEQHRYIHQQQPQQQQQTKSDIIVNQSETMNSKSQLEKTSTNAEKVTVSSYESTEHAATDKRIYYAASQSSTVTVVSTTTAQTPTSTKVDESNNVLLKQLLQNSNSTHNLNQISITSSHVPTSAAICGGQVLSARKVINVRAPSLGMVSSLEAQLARPVIPPVPASNSATTTTVPAASVSATHAHTPVLPPPPPPPPTITTTTTGQTPPTSAPTQTQTQLAHTQHKAEIVATKHEMLKDNIKKLNVTDIGACVSSNIILKPQQQQQIQTEPKIKTSVQIISKETSFISAPSIKSATHVVEPTKPTESNLTITSENPTVSGPTSKVTITSITKPKDIKHKLTVMDNDGNALYEFKKETTDNNSSLEVLSNNFPVSLNSASIMDKTQPPNSDQQQHQQQQQHPQHQQQHQQQHHQQQHQQQQHPQQQQHSRKIIDYNLECNPNHSHGHTMSNKSNLVNKMANNNNNNSHQQINTNVVTTSPGAHIANLYGDYKKREDEKIASTVAIATTSATRNLPNTSMHQLNVEKKPDTMPLDPSLNARPMKPITESTVHCLSNNTTMQATTASSMLGHHNTTTLINDISKKTLPDASETKPIGDTRKKRKREYQKPRRPNVNNVKDAATIQSGGSTVPIMGNAAAAAAAMAAVASAAAVTGSPTSKKRIQRKFSKIEEDYDSFIEKLMSHIRQMQPLQVLEPLLDRNFLICGMNVGKLKNSVSTSSSASSSSSSSRLITLNKSGECEEIDQLIGDYGEVRHPHIKGLYDGDNFGDEHNNEVKSLSSIHNDFYDQEFSSHIQQNPRERFLRQIGVIRDNNYETTDLIEKDALDGNSAASAAANSGYNLTPDGQIVWSTIPRVITYPGLVLVNNDSWCLGRMSPVAHAVEPHATQRTKPVKFCSNDYRKSRNNTAAATGAYNSSSSNNNNSQNCKNQNVVLGLTTSTTENIAGILRDLANLLHITPSLTCKIIEMEKNPKRSEDAASYADLLKVLSGTYKLCRQCGKAIEEVGIRILRQKINDMKQKDGETDQILKLTPFWSSPYFYFCSRGCFTQYRGNRKTQNTLSDDAIDTPTNGPDVNAAASVVGEEEKATTASEPLRSIDDKETIIRMETNDDELDEEQLQKPSHSEVKRSIIKIYSANCFAAETAKNSATGDAAVGQTDVDAPNGAVWNTDIPPQINEDTRQCVFCSQKGDGQSDGPSRLLNFDVDKWVHLNCALWSNGVYETISGGLMNFPAALQASPYQSCSACNQVGATVKCFKTRCGALFHLPCAIKENCVFYKNKTIHCQQHALSTDKETELTSLVVHRRVYVERDENRQVATVMHYSELSNLLRVGSLTFLNVGQLLPHQLEAFHTPNCIYPIGYKVSRYYWCMRRPTKRCRYVCTIAEVLGRPEFRIHAYDIGCDEEFRGETPTGVWQQVLEPINNLRKKHKLLQLFPQHITGEDLFGLTEPAIVRILESLPGIETLTNYRFKYGRNPLLEFPLAINPSGAARTEPKQRQLLVWRKPHTQRTANTTQRMANSAAVAGEVACPYSKQFVHSKSSQYKKMKQEWRNNVYLARSKIQGLGLYAARDIEKHTMIIEYIGEVIRTEVSEIREKQYEAKNRGIYMFRLDEDRVVDATLSGGLARYINHSCNPNCVTEIVEVDRDVRIIIFAKRKIYRGEELSYDYKFDIEDESHKIPCACGAPNCRKWMN